MMKKMYCVICGKCRKLEKLKISYFLEKTALSIICSKCKNEDEKTFKGHSIDIIKILALIENI